jgi:glucose/mannose-6-phosphate isomerase
MENLIFKFIQQIEEALILGENTILKPVHANKVFITGMGGSGIAGRFVAEIMKLHGTIPVIISNTYEVPSWVDDNTLALVSSFSGNTEETVTALNSLLNRKANIISISSGGKIIKISRENDLDLIQIPSDWSAPRACIGYSIIFQLFALFQLGYLKIELTKEISLCIELLLREREDIYKNAAHLAKLLKDKTPLIYSDSIFEPLAIRFRQQLNENTKILAFNSTFPEMNHNEIAAWTSSLSEFSAVFLISELYNERVVRRIEISKEIMINHTDVIVDIELKGNTVLQQIFYGIHIIDWISWFMAKNRNVDATDISSINFLKSELENHV